MSEQKCECCDGALGDESHPIDDQPGLSGAVCRKCFDIEESFFEMCDRIRERRRAKGQQPECLSAEGKPIRVGDYGSTDTDRFGRVLSLDPANKYGPIVEIDVPGCQGSGPNGGWTARAKTFRHAPEPASAKTPDIVDAIAYAAGAAAGQPYAYVYKDCLKPHHIPVLLHHLARDMRRLELLAPGWTNGDILAQLEREGSGHE